MKVPQRYTVPYRRKREGKTDYKKRLALLVSGRPRLVIRRSLKNVWLQIIEYSPQGDKVLASAHTRSLIKLGWKAARSNIPAAYLCGLLLGKRAKEKNIKEAVLDIGRNVSQKGGVIYAALKGCVDAGLEIDHAKEILPNEERVAGEHITAWASQLKSRPEQYKRYFGEYLKRTLAPENLPKHVEEIKTKTGAQ